MAKVNFNKLKKEVIDSAQQGLFKCAFLTKERLKQNVGLTDHDIEELAKLGHPYHPDHYRAIHSPEWVVHKQSGELYNSIKIVKESQNSYAIGADESIRDPETGAYYVIDVIEGTSKMVARNYPLNTLMELEENKVLEKTMEDYIKKGLDNI